VNVWNVRYRLSNASSDDKFTIDSVSGDIKTVGAIDRENKTTYRLTVLARSAGLPHSSAHVLIRVVDINDNSPTLQRHQTICCSRTTSRGHVVGRLAATDVDEGINARLTFRWNSYDHIGTELFQLSPDDGHVIAKTDLCAYVAQHFRFRVTVEDHGIPARSAVGTVSIIFNETCVVADQRRDTTPQEVAGNQWHIAAIVLVVSAVFGIVLGLGILVVCACRRSDRVSTRHKLAHSSDAFSLNTHKLRFVVTDDVNMVTYSADCKQCPSLPYYVITTRTPLGHM